MHWYKLFIFFCVLRSYILHVSGVKILAKNELLTTGCNDVVGATLINVVNNIVLYFYV